MEGELHRRVAILLLGVGVFAVLGTGCSSLKSIRVRALKPLNMNEEGESLPVRVRVYKLKARGAFDQASFEDLWAKDREILAGDLVDPPIEKDVYPGKIGQPPEEIPLGAVGEEVQFVGVFALYSQKDESGGRRHLVMTRREARGSVLELSGYRITVRQR